MQSPSYEYFYGSYTISPPRALVRHSWIRRDWFAELLVSSSFSAQYLPRNLSASPPPPPTSRMMSWPPRHLRPFGTASLAFCIEQSVFHFNREESSREFRRFVSCMECLLGVVGTLRAWVPTAWVLCWSETNLGCSFDWRTLCQKATALP